jgi:murein DD-endopeptidase MepM/ murein hydrolase activator NlpD
VTLISSPWVLAAAAAPLLLAGFLPLDQSLYRRWTLSGRWIYPVGDPLDFHLPSPDGAPAYSLTRNLRGEPDRHHGADLTNRRGGDPVRASAHGIVVSATHLGNGYGYHVVLAHRLPEGGLVYSVYAHLEPGSITVTTGEPVTFGQHIGRVGRSGVATASHLHFEVRRPRDVGIRWEHSAALDPLAFVAARLPTRDRDSTWARPYLAWAELGGLIRPGDPADRPVPLARWQRTLASAQCRPEDFLTGPILPPPRIGQDRVALDSLVAVTWHEVARDLERLRSRFCLPPGSPPEAERRFICRQRLDQETPARHLKTLGRRDGHPTLAELTLLLSDFTGD